MSQNSQAVHGYHHGMSGPSMSEGSPGRVATVWSRVPFAGWSLGGLLLFALVFQAWPLIAILGSVLLLALLGHGYERQRARRLLEFAPAGTGTWIGTVALYQAESLWGRSLPFWLSLSYSQDGYPARLTANAAGLQLHPGGWVFHRLARVKPALIPWTDVAGARSRPLGFRGSPEGATIRMVPTTAVTIDLVGPSADGHLPSLSAEEERELLRGVDINPDEQLAQADEDCGLSDEEQSRSERDIYGPDWRPGTEPLVLTTSEPRGLVDLVTTFSQGRPDRD